MFGMTRTTSLPGIQTPGYANRNAQALNPMLNPTLNQRHATANQAHGVSGIGNQAPMQFDIAARPAGQASVGLREQKNAARMAQLHGGGRGGGAYAPIPGDGMPAPGNPPAGFPGMKPGAVGGAGGTGMGQVTTSIDANPIYNQQQIQGAVNQGVAANNRTMSSAMNQASQNPFLSQAALAQKQTEMQNGAMQANANTRFQVPFQLASANASHLLGAQTARAQEGLGAGGLLARMDESSARMAQERANMEWAKQMGLFNTMSGLIGGM